MQDTPECCGSLRGAADFGWIILHPIIGSAAAAAAQLGTQLRLILSKDGRSGEHDLGRFGSDGWRGCSKEESIDRQEKKRGEASKINHEINK